MARRARKSFGFGKRFGMAKGPFRKEGRGAKSRARTLTLKHKGPKGTRGGKIRFFNEV